MHRKIDLVKYLIKYLVKMSTYKKIFVSFNSFISNAAQNEQEWFSLR